MHLTENQLRKVVRNLLMNELFVKPKNKKSSMVKDALSTDHPGGWYGDPQGFGEFDEEGEAEGHAHDAIDAIHDLAAAAGVDLDDGHDHGAEDDLHHWDGDELEDPHVDYGQKMRRPDHGDRLP